MRMSKVDKKRKSYLEEMIDYCENEIKIKEKELEKYSDDADVLINAIELIGELGIFLLNYIHNNYKEGNYISISISEILYDECKYAYDKELRKKIRGELRDICDYLYSIIYGDEENYNVIKDFRFDLFNVYIMVGEDFNIFYKEVEIYLKCKEFSNEWRKRSS